jgi:insertion element IS1 protein InsB
MYCTSCNEACVKKGLRNDIQQYYCKQCRKYQRAQYQRTRVTGEIKTNLVRLHKESLGIRSIARYLKISASSVVRFIMEVAGKLGKSWTKEPHQRYEVDELCTYIGNKSNRIWIAYAYCRESKSVVDFVIGARSKLILEPLINKILSIDPKTIYTYKHQTYATLIPKQMHSTICRGTNHIERMNLTLRTHLKRLNRRTICFSKSVAMLQACLMIYFFG